MRKLAKRLPKNLAKRLKTRALAGNDRPVALAAVTGAHGVRGEVRLKLFGQGSKSLGGFSCVKVGEKRLTLESVRLSHRYAVARFAEVSSRESAEALRGTLLTVERAALPVLASGEYYHHDLIGLPCVLPGGECLGHIVMVENFGAGDILEIERVSVSRVSVSRVSAMQAKAGLSTPEQNTTKPSQSRRKPKFFMVPMTAVAVLEWTDSRVVINPEFVP